MPPQLLSTIGAVLVVLAYGAHQFHRIHSDRIAYNLVNFIGGGMLAYAAFRPFQLGFVIMEGFWTIISLYGLLRAILRPPAAPLPGSA